MSATRVIGILVPLIAPIVAAVCLVGCDKPGSPKQDERRGTPPPDEELVVAGACAAGGGTISDSQTSGFFPRTVATYCVDPNGETRAYGHASNREIDAICLEAFNGDCELYKSFGLDRVVLFRYVDGAGSPGAIDVVLSKYTSAEGSFGMFTKRVISDGDPAREDAPKEIDVQGVGALGAGSVYLWKGQIMVELTYTNDRQTPHQVQASGAELLSALAKEVSAKLPAPSTLPGGASHLPADNLIPLGIRFEPKDAFDVLGGGAGAFGYYREGAKRYRVLSITRNDADQAIDVTRALGKRNGATRIRELGEGSVRLMDGDAADSAGPGDVRAEWVIGRAGNQIFGVGDETSVLKVGMSRADHEAVCLSIEDKISRLRVLLGAK